MSQTQTENKKKPTYIKLSDKQMKWKADFVYVGEEMERGSHSGTVFKEKFLQSSLLLISTA